jgi:hypothetical protein
MQYIYNGLCLHCSTQNFLASNTNQNSLASNTKPELFSQPSTAMYTKSITWTTIAELGLHIQLPHLVIYLAYQSQEIPRGLTVRIAGFHPAGPGSTPGVGTILF